MPNIHYIRAAILDATGIKLTLDEVIAYLVQEGLVTPSKAEKLKFTGYGDFYAPNTEVKEYRVPDLVELVEQ